MRYEFGRLIFGGAYFRNFIVLFEMRVDDRLWTRNAFSVARLFQNKVMFLLMIMLIYEKTPIKRSTSIKQPLAGTLRVVV